MDRFRARCYPASPMRFRAAAALVSLLVVTGGCTALHRAPESSSA